MLRRLIASRHIADADTKAVPRVDRRDGQYLIGQFFLIRDICQRFFLLFERIFEIDANKVGRNHCFDCLEHLFKSIPITHLDICRDATLDHTRDTGASLNQHVPADLLAIAIA
jgi:hypothetical protein